MKFIPEAIIEQIKEQSDIVEIVQEKVRLKRTGANYTGLCPFHSEKTPSFSVSRTKQIYKCFGCGEGGNVFTFLMKTQNLTFDEAVRHLAQRSGIEIPEENEEQADQRQARETLENINRTAARFYFDHLRQNPAARDYFLKRGITPETMTRFGLGYAPDSWDALYRHLIQKGFQDADIKASGLMSGMDRGKCYDRFRNRLIFPVFDPRGRITGFGARVLDDSKPKYLNSPETLLFHKGTNLYGMNFFLKKMARDESTLLIVEGYMDCIALHQAGIHQAVAALGTALTPIQARLMKRYVKRVITAFDADTAGQQATLRGLEILVHEGFEVRILLIPDGKDPDEYIRTHGREAFLKLMEKALSLTEFQINLAKEGLDLSREEDKVTYFKNLAPVLEKLTGIEKDIWVGKLADETGVSREAISSMVHSGYDRKLWMSSSRPAGFVESGHRKAQRYLLKLMAQGYDEVGRNIQVEELTGRSHQKIFELLLAYDGDNANAFLMSQLTQVEDQSEWAQIYGISDLPADIEVDRLITDYIRTVRYYNLKARKNAMVKEIEVLEKEGRLAESLEAVRELLEIQKELGGK
ncbi:DNA primase [Clostridiaceae bacterium HFYG-1003]|nr:DNA primase [Clostridiaceae bacterium HFYG-1003]